MKKAASRVLLCTCPTTKANGVARLLLEERLVSRVNVVPGVTGLYGMVAKKPAQDETLLVMRADRRRVKVLEDRLGEMLPGKPEMLNVSGRRGGEPYMTWTVESAAC